MISHFEGQQHVLSIPNLSEGFFGNLKKTSFKVDFLNLKLGRATF